MRVHTASFFVSQLGPLGNVVLPRWCHGPSVHVDLFGVTRSPGQSPVSRPPPLRLRLWGRVPRSSLRPDRRRRSEEPELRSPQLRRWRLSRPSRPQGLRGTCICRGNGSSFFLKHFGIKVPEVSSVAVSGDARVTVGPRQQQQRGWGSRAR